MNVLRKYKHFINEAVDTDSEVKSLSDVPGEVIETARKIAGDIFDRVRKPIFEYTQDGLIMKFQVSQQDFEYIDEHEPLKLDMSGGAMKKKNYEVILNYYDRITETFEVSYIVNFRASSPVNNMMGYDEDYDVIVDDDYENSDKEEYFDEDEADKQIKKGKIKIKDIQDDMDYDVEEEDD